MQRRFVDELLKDPKRNGSQAALRAGFTPKAAKESAYQLLSKPHVAEAVEKGLEQQAKDVGITKERLLQELARTAFTDLNSLVSVDENGNLDVNMKNLPREAAISEIEITRGSKKSTKIRLSAAEKLAALNSLAKMLGWSKEKVEVSGTFSLLSLVNASYDEDVIDAESVTIVPTE